jgi:hypothetical protein
MGGFFSSIFGGENDTLNKNIGQFGQDAGVAGKIGAEDTGAASKFFTDVLSGDPTKEGQAIAPETSAIQQRGQQQKNQLAQFAPRSGGTAATTSAIDSSGNAELIKLLGGLQTTAASGAASLGTAEQGLSLQDKQAQDAASQQRMQNWMNSILGRGITEASSAAESAGLGAIGL